MIEEKLALSFKTLFFTVRVRFSFVYKVIAQSRSCDFASQAFPLFSLKKLEWPGDKNILGI
jgi:hypothetical protein